MTDSGSRLCDRADVIPVAAALKKVVAGMLEKVKKNPSWHDQHVDDVALGLVFLWLCFFVLWLCFFVLNVDVKVVCVTECECECY